MAIDPPLSQLSRENKPRLRSCESKDFLFVKLPLSDRKVQR